MSFTFQPISFPAAWTPVEMSWHWVSSHSRSTKVLPFVAGCVSGVFCGMVVGAASYCLTVASAAATSGLLDVAPGALAEVDDKEALSLELLLHAATTSSTAMVAAASTTVRKD